MYRAGKVDNSGITAAKSRHGKVNFKADKKYPERFYSEVGQQGEQSADDSQ